jgi:hypothetical protein
MDGSCGTQLDHGVLCVGYDASGSSPYWLVRNSWGSSWGDDGNVKLGMNAGGRDGECGILMDPSYPIV